jgi:predicted nucleic acid-binding protein
MQGFVIDTSVIAGYFIDTPFAEKSKELLVKSAQGKIKLYAPGLIWYELYSVLIKNYDSKAEARAALILFEQITDRGIIEIKETNYFLNQALDIAFSEATGKQGYIGPFDAYFHGLAIYLGCNFLTSDKKHYNKTKDSFGNIILFEDLKLN